ncbi:hypothetical protein [Acinetobacter baumannii]|uniref:hypothetical protein n=1 Tax=Acinetobacter baumannii TaxID=470 RepID=UPI0020BDE193|nr:hypothetical protein [Acinetobacter baumannii]MCL6175122.1 hypothetical protein [Acinetobacter baumannii]MCL6179940.1 hypothetical protein [Acinetobacter baumannii]MCL6186848.1 hypothetical protein [Acinetobacter baumannii]MCL6207999.1 hypothetical protein [Acinetobacter baumannii]MCL6211413.1 hypothetical protein [Acinetobacter baumannii]
MKKYKIFFFAIFVFFLIFKFLNNKYHEYIINKNEEKGFCTSENKYLTDEEKLRNLKADFLAIEMEHWIRASREGFNVYDNAMYISKFNFNNKEKIIEVIRTSKIDKTFEENMGVVAVATMKEYYSNKDCKKDKRKCKDLSENKNNLKSLWTKDNRVDIDYLKSLPINYSVITYGRTIYPLSSLKKISNSNYSIEEYSIDKLCCDNKEILKSIKTIDLKMIGNMKIMKEGKKNYSTKEPDLNLDQIDGQNIDNIYIMKLYENLALNEPEQIQRYGMRMSMASLRKDIYPFIRRILVTACGTISEEEQVFNSSETQSGEDVSLRKRNKLY